MDSKLLSEELLGKHILQPQKIPSRNSNASALNSAQPESPDSKLDLMATLPNRSQSANKRQISMVESMVELNDIANDVVVDDKDKNMKDSKPSGHSTQLSKTEDDDTGQKRPLLDTKLEVDSEAPDPPRDSIEALLPNSKPGKIVAEQARRDSNKRYD